MRPRARHLIQRRRERAGSGLVWFGLLVSIAFLYVFLRNVEWALLGESLKETRLSYVLPALVLVFGSYVLRALRWQVMLGALQPTSFSNIFSAVNIGFMASCILPARAGELIRAVLVGKAEGLRVSSIFASIVVERILDLLVIVGMMVPVLLTLTTGSEHADLMRKLRATGFVFGAIVLVGLGAITLLRARPSLALRWLLPVLGRLPGGLGVRLEKVVVDFVEGLRTLRSGGATVAVLLLSVLLWVDIAAINWVLAMGFPFQLSFSGACLLVVVTAFAVALPQAPGFVGVFHVAAETTLRILGASTYPAKGYAIVLWGISTIPVTLFGFLLLWRLGLSLRDISAPQPEG